MSEERIKKQLRVVRILRGFIAVMIDGDNTQSSGVCYFADIRFLAEMPKADAATAEETARTKP